MTTATIRGPGEENDGQEEEGEEVPIDPPADQPFRVTVRKLVVPARPRGVLAE